MHNDLTFFTNEPDATLLDRFRKTLKDARFFDILVGYFRLYKSFETIEKIRVLVGINIDKTAFEAYDSKE